MTGNENLNDVTKEQEFKPLFFSFAFYKIDPKWLWLNEIGRDEAAKEFASLIEVAKTKVKIRTYSTMGLRKESDFLIWCISDNVEKIQVLSSKIKTTIFGKYVEASHLFLSCTRPSVYSNKIIEGFSGESEDEIKRYVVVYPFIKSREWYLLPFDERKRMMEEHIKVGRKFPDIKLNTSYSFGLDDQDFMLAFETDSLFDFQNLIIQLRETEVSKYVVKDTPMIVSVYRKVEDIIKSLG